MAIILEKDRDWERITEQDKILYLLNDKLSQSGLFKKGSEPPIEFIPVGPEEDGSFQFAIPENSELNEKVTLYSTLKRQLELDFDFVKLQNPTSVLLRPLEARISKNGRSFPRYVLKNGVVLATNFQVGKNEKNIDHTRSQVGFQIIYKDYEKKLAHEYPGIRIVEFSAKDRPRLTELLNKKDGLILVPDLSRDEAFVPPGEEFLDVRESLDEDELSRLKRELLEQKINSVAVLPMRMETVMGIKPIAFLYYEARGEKRIDSAVFDQLEEASEDILQRIRDASTVTVSAKQRVLNVSEGGIALEITDPELIKHLPTLSWITFDLVFKLQAPMRFHGKICHISQQKDLYQVGVDLEGSALSVGKTNPRTRLKSLIKFVSDQTE